VGCPTVPLEIRMLIRTMSTANPLWGAPRIHGELLKLGIEVGQATVAKYMVGQRQPPSQTWRTFVRNHGGQNAYVECVIGAIRRECLDHLIILNAADCVASSAGTSDTTRRHARIWCSRRTLPCPPCVSTHLRGNRRDSSGRRSSPPIRTSRCLASSAEGSQRRGRDRQPRSCRMAPSPTCQIAARHHRPSTTPNAFSTKRSRHTNPHARSDGVFSSHGRKTVETLAFETPIGYQFY
jgi:hypothetical protein